MIRRRKNLALKEKGKLAKRNHAQRRINLAVRKGKTCPEKRRSCPGGKILQRGWENITQKEISVPEEGKILPRRRDNLALRKGNLSCTEEEIILP